MFLINLIPLHVLVLMLTGRFSHRIYVAYCTVYCLGTILSMQISFVGFQVKRTVSFHHLTHPPSWTFFVNHTVSHCSVLCLPFFIYQPVQSSEHMAAFGVFGLCQIHAFVDYLRSKLNAQQFEVLFKSVISLVGFILLSAGAVLMLTGKRINNNSNEWENLCKSF